MNGMHKVLILGIGMGAVIVSACTKEPESGAECFEMYSKDVKNYKAVQEISKACAEIFDANKYDDVYYRCLLDRLPKDKTDKDVNISIRKCTMKSEE